ncbi:phosphoethanolamine transferase EptA [Enterobacterales bacterium CwR94]|nr:phosphoethanolamine transferase EptA [Enterobacterales bacterium CwR94]
MNALKKLRCHSTLFNLAVALFFTVVANGLFIWRAWQLIEFKHPLDYLFAASIPLVLFSAFMLIFSVFALPWIRKPLIAVLIIVSAAVNYFMFTFGTVIDTNMLQNVFETTQQETLALITPRYLIWLFVAGIIPIALMCAVRIVPNRPWWMRIAVRSATALASVMVILLVALFFYKDYASLIRNNKSVVKLVTPANAVSGMGHYVQDRWFAGSQELVRIGLDAKKGPQLQAEPRKTLVVFVLGETARAENFSLGGYARETNPKLKQQHVVYYPQATSCGTETAVSVPCMFSNMPRTAYDAKLARHQEGLLDVMAHAGVQVLWRENDGGCKGACDRIPHTDMTQWKLPSSVCRSDTCFDDALLWRLNHYIDGLHDDGVIVLHQMGSHGPAYYQRYPQAMRQFTPTCDTNQIQNCDHQALVNTYDNTVLATDSMLDDTINLLKTYGDKFNVALIYLSDHGESLGESGMYLHGAPYVFAPSQQTHIPFLMWFSPQYKQAFKLDETCLRQQAATNAVSQDNLFSTLLGMMNIQTTEYQAKMDILHTCRPL